MAMKKSSTRRTRAARTTTGATKPMKTTAKLRPVQATSTLTEIVHAGLMALRHRLQARPATARGRAANRSRRGHADRRRARRRAGPPRGRLCARARARLTELSGFAGCEAAK